MQKGVRGRNEEIKRLFEKEIRQATKVLRAESRCAHNRRAGVGQCRCRTRGWREPVDHGNKWWDLQSNGVLRVTLSERYRCGYKWERTCRRDVQSDPRFHKLFGVTPLIVAN